MDCGADVGGGGGAAATGGADEPFPPAATPAGARLHAEKRERERVTLYRALRTACLMLQERGYALSRVGGKVWPADPAAGLEPFKSPARAQRAEDLQEVVLEGTVPASPVRYSAAWAAGLPPGTKVVVVVLGKGKVDAIRQVAAHLPDLGAASAVLLSSKPLTPQSRKEVGAAALQHFLYSELQRAVTRHMWVPRHVPLDAAMEANLRARYPGAKLFRMWSTDPVARFLGFLPGQCVVVREVFGRDQPTLAFYEVADNYAARAGGGGR